MLVAASGGALPRWSRPDRVQTPNWNKRHPSRPVDALVQECELSVTKGEWTYAPASVFKEGQMPRTMKRAAEELPSVALPPPPLRLREWPARCGMCAAVMVLRAQLYPTTTTIQLACPADHERWVLAAAGSWRLHVPVAMALALSA